MKRLLSLALVLILIMSSILLVACDDKTDEPAATTTAATTAVEDNGGNGGGSEPADPVGVDSVNGMTITELYRKFVDEYTTATTYDIVMDSRMKVDGVDAQYRYEAKMSPDAYYIKVVYDEITAEYWIVDGVIYAKMLEEKYKAPAVSEGGESILGMMNENGKQ